MLTSAFPTFSTGIRPALVHAETGVCRAASALFQLKGGVSGLFHFFQQYGQGDLMAAWCDGDVRPITPQLLMAMIGHDLLQQLATIADLSMAQTLAGLCDFLPGYIANEVRSVERMT